MLSFMHCNDVHQGTMLKKRTAARHLALERLWLESKVYFYMYTLCATRYAEESAMDLKGPRVLCEDQLNM